jgi:hypothetical protein
MVITATTITVAIVGLLLVLVAYQGVLAYQSYRKSGTFTFNWLQVVGYAQTAVEAVAQTNQVKPEGMTDQAWNELRQQKAIDLVVAFARQFNITVNADSLAVIVGAIEQAVLRKKQNAASGLVQGQSLVALPNF